MDRRPLVFIGNAQLAELPVGDSVLDKNKNGFVNRTDSAYSFNDGTRTFTIAPVSVSFIFYANGVEYIKTTAQTVTITDTEGQWFIYFNSAGVLIATQTFTPLLITEYAFVSVLYWDATNNVAILIGDERHGCIMDSQTHLYLHNTHGSAIDYPVGLAITNIVADGNGNVANQAQVGISGGGIWDEDIEHVIATLNAPASLPVFYLTGAGLWRRKTATSYPLLYGVTGTRANYNLFSGGVWTVEEVASSQHTLSHFFATNDPNQPIIVIAGQNDYTTVGDARAGALVELQTLNTIGLPTQEFVAIATIIFQTSNTYSNVPKSRIRTTDAGDSYVGWLTTRIGSGGTAATVGWGNITGTLASQVDLQAELDAKENSLGNPASDGQVLSSTAAGVRSWASVSSGLDVAITANTGTAYTVNLANGSLFDLTLTGNCTFTFPTATLGTKFTLLLQQDATGSRTITWPISVRWANSVTPIINSIPYRTDIISFVAEGSDWLGYVIGSSYGSSLRPIYWTFTVSSVYPGYTNPPTKAGLSNGVNTVAGTDSFASANGSGVSYITADFGEVCFVTNAFLMCVSSTTLGWGETYTNGRLLQISSDGTSWTTVATISGVTNTNTVTIPVNSNCRYIRVYNSNGYVTVGDFYFS